MKVDFEYDGIKDFPKLTKWHILANYFMATSTCMFGVLLILKSSMSESPYILILGIFISLLSLTGFLWASGPNRFIYKEGKHYLRIKNSTISWKLGLFQKERSIPFKDIKKILFSENSVFVSTLAHIEQHIPVNRIADQDKKNEFLSLMKNLKPNQF